MADSKQTLHGQGPQMSGQEAIHSLLQRLSELSVHQHRLVVTFDHLRGVVEKIIERFSRFSFLMAMQGGARNLLPYGIHNMLGGASSHQQGRSGGSNSYGGGGSGGGGGGGGKSGNPFDMVTALTESFSYAIQKEENKYRADLIGKARKASFRSGSPLEEEDIKELLGTLDIKDLEKKVKDIEAKAYSVGKSKLLVRDNQQELIALLQKLLAKAGADPNTLKRLLPAMVQQLVETHEDKSKNAKLLANSTVDQEAIDRHAKVVMIDAETVGVGDTDQGIFPPAISMSASTLNDDGTYSSSTYIEDMTARIKELHSALKADPDFAPSDIDQQMLLGELTRTARIMGHILPGTEDKPNPYRKAEMPNGLGDPRALLSWWEDALTSQGPLAAAKNSFISFLEKAFKEGALGAHNLPFDQGVLLNILEGSGVNLPSDGTAARTVDTADAVRLEDKKSNLNEVIARVGGIEKIAQWLEEHGAPKELLDQVNNREQSHGSEVDAAITLAAFNLLKTKVPTVATALEKPQTEPAAPTPAAPVPVEVVETAPSSSPAPVEIVKEEKKDKQAEGLDLGLEDDSVKPLDLGLGDVASSAPLMVEGGSSPEAALERLATQTLSEESKKSPSNRSDSKEVSDEVIEAALKEHEASSSSSSSSETSPYTKEENLAWRLANGDPLVHGQTSPPLHSSEEEDTAWKLLGGGKGGGSKSPPGDGGSPPEDVPPEDEDGHAMKAWKRTGRPDNLDLSAKKFWSASLLFGKGVKGEDTAKKNLFSFLKEVREKGAVGVTAGAAKGALPLAATMGSQMLSTGNPVAFQTLMDSFALLAGRLSIMLLPTVMNLIGGLQWLADGIQNLSPGFKAWAGFLVQLAAIGAVGVIALSGMVKVVTAVTAALALFGIKLKGSSLMTGGRLLGGAAAGAYVGSHSSVLGETGGALAGGVAGAAIASGNPYGMAIGGATMGGSIAYELSKNFMEGWDKRNIEKENKDNTTAGPEAKSVDDWISSQIKTEGTTLNKAASGPEEGKGKRISDALLAIASTDRHAARRTRDIHMEGADGPIAQAEIEKANEKERRANLIKKAAPGYAEGSNLQKTLFGKNQDTPEKRAATKAAMTAAHEQVKAAEGQKGLLLSLRALAASPQYSDIGNAYKKVQLDVLSKDPMLLQLEKMQREGLEKMVALQMAGNETLTTIAGESKRQVGVDRR